MPDPNRKIFGWAIVAVCVVVALIIASSLGGSGGSNSPEKYLRKHFDHVSGTDPDSDTGIVFEDGGDPASVATTITDGTDADENREDAGSHYLRYDDDWLVVVEPGSPSGSRITLYEYDRGYHHHVGVIGLWGWNSYYGRNSSHGGRDSGGSFRGGGSGFGK